MKLKLFYFLPALLGFCTIAAASYGNERFKNEIATGLDIVTRDVPLTEMDYQGGALGMEVYSMTDISQEQCCANSSLYCCKKKADKIENDGSEYALFIQSNMYIRAGAGFNLNFATSRATYGPANYKADSAGTWGTQIGLGWNLNQNIRLEGDILVRHFRFSDAPWSAYDLKAKTQSVGGTAYFDLLPRYQRHGDLTRPTRFVPFIGFGASVGAVDFSDAGVQPIGFGHGERNMYIAPRAAFGVSLALSELVKLDIVYQYEMMLLGKFGWETDPGFTSISDIIASFRFNF